MHDERLADASDANPFRLPTQEWWCAWLQRMLFERFGDCWSAKTFSAATSSGAPQRIPRNVYNAGHVLWATLDLMVAVHGQKADSPKRHRRRDVGPLTESATLRHWPPPKPMPQRLPLTGQSDLRYAIPP